MALLSSPSTQNLVFSNPKFTSVNKRLCYPHSPHLTRFPGSNLCLCVNANSSSSDNPSSSPSPSPSPPWWDSTIQDVLRKAVESFGSFVNSYVNSDNDSNNGNVSKNEGQVEKDEEDWDWERWMKHFDQVDEQERLLSVLKSQLDKSILREDYDDAAKFKVAIAAAAIKDTVGRVMRRLNRALAEERYQDAIFLRDKAGAGLVGWWSGISEDAKDPYGLIIRITAEHGRYVARKYSPRQLSTAGPGAPLFEIFLTMNKKGEYRKQAVYLKRRGVFQDSSTVSSNSLRSSSHYNTPSKTDDKNDMFVANIEDEEGGNETDDSSDLAEGLSGFQNILHDMIPGVEVKVVKVTVPEKADRDFISNVIEQIIDDEDEEKDFEDLDDEDEIIKGESDLEKDDELEIDASGLIDNEEPSEIAVKIVIESSAQNFSGNFTSKESVRSPAKLETKGQSSFSLSIEKDITLEDSTAEQASADKKAKLLGQRTINDVMLDLAKSLGNEKISMKVLKDVGNLLKLSLSEAKSRQPLSGSTTFNRLDVTSSRDPLDGLYIGAHGLHSSEIIHLRRKFGQWKEDSKTKASRLEFYEYVEAVKLTGDPSVPAGQIAFRAKVGKGYQLPHRGIIPEEFGVIARYKGQGRVAEPGFRNPRWVNGELVILDGKYIKGGPVVGFVYWAPEFQFLVFFTRLRLQS